MAAVDSEMRTELAGQIMVKVGAGIEMKTFLRVVKATLVLITSLALLLGSVWLLSLTNFNELQVVGFVVVAFWASAFVWVLAWLWKMIYDDIK